MCSVHPASPPVQLMLRKAPGPGKAPQFEGLRKPGARGRRLDGDFQREKWEKW